MEDTLVIGKTRLNQEAIRTIPTSAGLDRLGQQNAQIIASRQARYPWNRDDGTGRHARCWKNT
jgi:hypothetical protein